MTEIYGIFNYSDKQKLRPEIHKGIESKNEATIHYPFSDPTKKIWIVIDGFVTNKSELKHQFEKLGYQFRSQTDEEYFLFSYLQEGSSFLDLLTGVFSGAIIDLRNLSLILFRDREGTKSLYYTVSKGKIIFSSKIKSLFKHPEVFPEADPKGYIDFLYTRHRPAPKTMFKNIFKLRNSEYIQFNNEGKKTEIQYWTPLNRTLDSSFGNDFFVHEVKSSFYNAIREKSADQNDVGIFLSGGLDSCALLAGLRKVHPGPIHTINLGFKYSNNRNQPLSTDTINAKKMAETFKTIHHQEYLFDWEYFDRLQEVIDKIEDLSIASEQVLFLKGAQAASKIGIPIVFTGEGGLEEYLCSSMYLMHYRALNKKWKKIQALPRSMIKLLDRIHRFTNTRKESFNYREEWLWLLGQGRFPYLMEGNIMNDSILRSLFTKEFLTENYDKSHYECWKTLENEVMQADTAVSLLQRLSYYDWRLLISDILNVEAEKIGSSFGVEITPIINTKLIELIFKIPDDVKATNNEPKYLLKKAMVQILPNEIIYQQKSGFTDDMGQFFSDNFARFTKETFKTSGMHCAGIFDQKRINEIIHLHQQKKADYTPILMALTMLFLWHQRWIQNGEKRI